MDTQKNMAEIEKLEPQAVWKYFARISAVPRPSKREDKIRTHIHEVIKELNLQAVQDDAGNIVVTVPASAGCENAPITVLQGHLDMVPEKNAGTTHDFDNDPIQLILDKDQEGKTIIRANQTTLGADNGIGIAMALAVAASPDIVHGPLELLFTADEEEGMTGANALTPQSFKGRRLLNLDSEEDDALYMGCAGGCDTNFDWSFPLSQVPADWETCRITVSGLRGGHSGGDIHESRGCANKLLVRTLIRSKFSDIRINSINGGSKRNAISREAVATISGPAGLKDALASAAKTVQQQAIDESVEPNAAVTVETIDGNGNIAISKEDTEHLITALTSIPHGVMGMHPKVDGLVQTSNNLGIIKSEQDENNLLVKAANLSRSSSESRIDETLDQLAAIGKLAGANITTGNRYPGWEPDPESPVLNTCKKVYRELFNSDPNVAAIHAGLECGIIGERVGGVDMASFGPRIEGAHSPDERVWVESVQKSWRYLLAVLKTLAN